MDLKKYFSRVDVQEIDTIVKEIKKASGRDLRETAIGILVAGDADHQDHKGISRVDNDNVAAKAWIIAVLTHLTYKGYEIKKK